MNEIKEILTEEEQLCPNCNEIYFVEHDCLVEPEEPLCHYERERGEHNCDGCFDCETKRQIEEEEKEN
jgi:hypothetical protein